MYSYWYSGFHQRFIGHPPYSILKKSSSTIKKISTTEGHVDPCGPNVTMTPASSLICISKSFKRCYVILPQIITNTIQLLLSRHGRCMMACTFICMCTFVDCVHCKEIQQYSWAVAYTTGYKEMWGAQSLCEFNQLTDANHSIIFFITY